MKETKLIKLIFIDLLLKDIIWYDDCILLASVRNHQVVTNKWI